MNRLAQWWQNYSTEITWFIIGWLAMGCLEAIGREQWITAAVDAGLIYLNYKLWKR